MMLAKLSFMSVLAFSTIQARAAEKGAACEPNLESTHLEFGEDGKPKPSLRPRVGYIDGDGIGPEIMPVAREVLDAAVELAYGGARKIDWREVLAGEKALETKGENLPAKSLEKMKKLGVTIKGPMATPTGKGFRSLNVAIRNELDLFSCERPVRHYPNVPSPVTEPEKLCVRLFRENIEDVYAGIEFEAGSKGARRMIKEINAQLKREKSGKKLPKSAAIGIKFATRAGTERLMRRAIDFALAEKVPSLTIVHKGNIQKYTDGGFLKWAREFALAEYRDQIVTEEEWAADGWKPQPGKLVLNDRIADNMFQQALLKPDQYHVLVTQNLNGDYLSDALAAQVGGLGIAPGGNIGFGAAVFEATHGTAPDIAGRDLANPTSLILSGAMMLEYLDWPIAKDVIEDALRRTFEDRVVTGDFRAMEGARVVGTKEFGREVIRRMKLRE